MVSEKRGIKFLNACLLIIGTSIGAGMLGMPVEAGQGGYIPSLIFLTFSWVASFISALFFVEALSFIKASVNFSTLSEKIIGKTSKVYILLVYLLLFLSLIFAYTKGGGVFIADLLPSFPIWLGTFLFLLVLFPFILKGAKSVGKINSFLTFPMAIAFVLLLVIGTKEINVANLTHKHWANGFVSLPILVTAFGFHGIIPSLFNYLNHNKTVIRRAIIVGSIATLAIYVFWQTYIMGIIPLNGEISLSSALMQDQTAITPLRKIVGSASVSYLANLFYFCALTTSFLGVSLGLTDFLIDAFRLKNTAYNKFVITLLIFIPAFILSGTSLRVFYLSLKYGSGLACTLLLILFPTVLVSKLLAKGEKKQKAKILKIGIGFTLIYSAIVIFSQLLGVFTTF